MTKIRCSAKFMYCRKRGQLFSILPNKTRVANTGLTCDILNTKGIN